MTIFMTIYVSILGQQKIRNFLTYGLLIREKSDIRNFCPYVSYKIHISEKGFVNCRSLQPYFVPFPLSHISRVLKSPSSKKVANRLLTHSLRPGFRSIPFRSN